MSDLSPAADQVCDVFDGDLGDPDSTRILIADISTRRPEINIVVNKAAVQGPIGPLQQNDLREWEHAVKVNLLGPVALCKGLIPRMAGARDASIINLSGGGATAPRANFFAYASAKAVPSATEDHAADQMRLCFFILALFIKPRSPRQLDT